MSRDHLDFKLPVEGLADLDAVSATLIVPVDASACFVFAHGAGAGMTHPFMAALSDALAGNGIATLRYQFPGMERGSRRPDVPRIAHATVRAAVAEARRRLAALPTVAGGKSFGGRMTSQAQALAPMPGVAGLVFVGFPLHPADKPGIERAEHLRQVAVPMLFLQGTRDALADVSLLQAAIAPLGPRAVLRLFDGADHAFQVRARDGGGPQLLEAMAAGVRDWIRTL
jgi:predicted alpha/beta-hydrolase family hydrolase